MIETVLSRRIDASSEGVMDLLNPDYLNAIAQMVLAGAALIVALRQRNRPRE